MIRWFLAVFITACATPSVAAQVELRTDVGFSDSAFWTSGERTHQHRFAVEIGNVLRYGVTFLKEGHNRFDGWGVELTFGKRWSLGAGFLGTFRGGVGVRMQSEASAHFSEGPEGEFLNWTWRTLRLNVSVMDEVMVYPFASYGVQYDVRGPFFVDAQLRLSLHSTRVQWAWGREGAIRSEESDSWTPVPGYHIGLGFRF